MPKKKTSFDTNEVELKVTSIEVVPDLLQDFRKECIDNPLMSMKKLLNRSMYLYLNDEKFKSEIHSCTALVTKGRL